jgi:hypothetical protein
MGLQLHPHSAVASVSQSLEAAVGARSSAVDTGAAGVGPRTTALGARSPGVDAQPAAMGEMVMVALRVPRR